MSKEIKKNNKGFTLIEILVAVLILAILVAIALPTYNRAVEKSRASDPINTLKSIAKAEQVQKLRAGEYTNRAQDLDIQLRDYPTGDIVAGDTFEGQYYTYKVYGEGVAAATATRKAINDEDFYELSVDYGTGEIFCRPATNKICIDLNLEEGRDHNPPPQWENCSGQLDSWWSSNFGAAGPQESRTASCQVMVSQNGDRVDFDFCQSSAVPFTLLSTAPQSGMLSPYGIECLKGYISGNNKLAFCGYSSNSSSCDANHIWEKVGDYDYIRYSYNKKTDTWNTLFFRNNNQTNISCYEYDSNGVCTRCNTTLVDCGVFHRPEEIPF